MSKTRIDPGPFVVPMPLVLVGAVVDGRANFMTAAFVGIVNFKPPIVACALNPTHHTAKGIEQAQTFSLNLRAI
jgi:flavin reductase (DIM6/NTAB) family NADH-FMN oxidoreductase RutF